MSVGALGNSSPPPERRDGWLLWSQLEEGPLHGTRSRIAIVSGRWHRCSRGRHACSPRKSYRLSHKRERRGPQSLGALPCILPGCSPEHRILRRRQVKQLQTIRVQISVAVFPLPVPEKCAPPTYAALTRRRLVWGWPSVATKRICRGPEALPPVFFLGEGGLIASEKFIRGRNSLGTGLRCSVRGVDESTDEAPVALVRDVTGYRADEAVRTFVRVEDRDWQRKLHEAVLSRESG